MSTNLYGMFLWQMETYFVNEKREIHTIHNAMALKKVINGTLVASCWARSYPKKYLPLNFFNIHYLCKTLPQMCKNLYGETLAHFQSVVNFAKFQRHKSFPPYGMLQLYPTTSRISLLLQQSKAKPRTSVNSNDILRVQWDITCLYLKGLSQSVLLLWNNR